MLTPQQLTQLKTNVSSTGSVPPSQAMTPEQAKAWIGGGTTPSNSNPIADFGNGVATDFKNRVQNDKTINHSNESLPSKIYQNLGQGAGFLGDIVGEGIKAVTPQPVKNALSSAATAALQTPAGQGLTKAWSDFEAAHPELAGNIKATGNIASILPIGEGVGLAAKGAEKGVDLAKTGVNAVKDSLGDAKTAATTAVEHISPTPTSKEVVGKITQASTPQELKAAETTLNTIDTTGVKTFKDLSSQIDKKIKENTTSVDTELGKDTTPRKIQSLATEVKIGDATVRHNYVLDAIKQLKEYYTKTNDVASLGKIKAIEAKLDPIKGEGLTPKEVNDLARLHGKDLNAYNANGELASGLTKQAAENTRTGLKETVRNLMTNDTTRATDKSTTALIHTKELVDDMAEKVQKLQNKWQKAGVLQKLGGYVGKGVDIASGGILKGVFKTLLDTGSVEGSSLNAIQLEERLAKNLELLKKLDAMEPTKAIEELKGILPTEESPKVQGEIPKSTSQDTSPLAQEAQKYSSAEEFVNNQKPIFHGTPEKFDTFDTSKSEGGASWFTADKSEITNGKAGAVQGAGQKLNIMDRYLKPDLKLATPEMEQKLYTDQLIAEGYRGVKHPAGDYGAEWTKLFYPNEDTLTKSQLTDFYNKVKGK